MSWFGRGCPRFEGSELLWSNEACTWSSEDYRRLQEVAYSNPDGTSAESIYVLLLAFPSLIAILHSLRGFGWSDPFTVALLMSFHFSTQLPLTVPALLLLALLLELRRLCKAELTWEENFSKDGRGRLRFVSEYRALVMMSTCIAILAVDFASLFPRAAAKTDEFGFALMDVGTGSIIFSSGVCSKPSPQLRQLLKLWPVVLIGSVRAALLWHIDYHVVPGEYGLHWNFFFTIAVVSISSTLITKITDRPACAALCVLAIYQFYLSYLGGVDFILHADRVGLFSANREGVLSSAGYLSLHFLGVAVASLLRSSGVHCVLQLLAVALAGYAGVGLPSRRMCNLPYVLFILSLNTYVLALLALLDLLAGRPRPAMSLTLAGVADSMLLIFLLANLLTGVLNMSLQPLLVPFWPALLIVSCYTFLWSMAAFLWKIW